MVITPQSEIRLLKVPFELDEKNQLTFESLQAQTNYFLSLPYIELDNATYVRKDEYLRFPTNIDNIITYNYCMYKNEAFSNKWFYAFITDMKFENPNMTYITLKTDVFQTWQFNMVYHRMFVEREHVNKSDDIPERHTVPEGLETGEYVIESMERDTSFDNLSYVIQTLKSTGGTDLLATNYGGIYLAGGAYICPDINTFINIIQVLAQYDSVFGAYVIPTAIVNNTSGTLQYSGQSSPVLITKTFDKPTNINGYVPKNKKLLTFPYCFMNVSNNNGTTNTLRYEQFNDDEGQIYFIIKGVPVPGGSIKCIPINYGSLSNQNEDEGIIAGKFPTLSWAQDLYTNWLTQNGVNLSVGLSKEILGTSAGKADMPLQEKIANKIAGQAITTFGGALGIKNTMSEVYQHALSPYTARGNTNGGDINTCSQRNCFIFSKVCIRQEYAKIIDDFFSMYGYKVNSVKVPNITGRTNWNYVKTIECNITGEIPQGDLQELKNMFDNGVTFWHNASTFLDYSQTNN